MLSFAVGDVVVVKELASSQRFTGRVTTTSRDHFSIRLEWSKATKSFYRDRVTVVEIVDNDVWDMSHIPANM